MELYLLDISERLTEPVDGLLPLFSPERQAAILRRRAAADRNRTVWAELLARWLIAQRTKQPIDAVEILRDSSGKPFAKGVGFSDTLEFSLSHSGPWVACGIGTAACGVDVEAGRRADLSVARRFFLPEEARRLEALPETERKSAFLRYWTLKESYVKLIGCNLMEGMRADCEALLRGSGPIAGWNFTLPDGAVAGACAPVGSLMRLVSLKAPGRRCA